MVHTLDDGVEARSAETAIIDAYGERLDSHQEWRDAINRYDDFMRGKWKVELADGRTVEDRPRIENRTRTFVEDHSKLAASVMPTYRVESITDTDAQKKAALVREQVLNFYHQESATNILYPMWYADMEVTGLAVIKTWTDFQKPLDQRFPVFSRLDPRGVLPPAGWVAGDPVLDLLYVRHGKMRDLRRLFPAAEWGKLATTSDPLTDTDDVRLVEYFTPRVYRMVALRAMRGQTRSVTLVSAPNRTGRLPVELVPRPTVDGRLRGMFDDLLAVVAAENRIQTYLLNYLDQVVYAPFLNRSSKPIKIGPNEVIDLNPGEDVTRAQPAPIQAELFHLSQNLEQHSRRAGISPAARAGDISQSQASSALVESLMGGLTTHIQSLQARMEHGMRRANEVAFLVDREYCNTKKSIVGMARGKLFRTTYTPGKDISDGELANLVQYGLASGLTRFNHVLMLQRLEQAGYVTKDWVRGQIEGVEDPERQANGVIDERMLESLLVGIYARANQGDLGPWIEFQRVRKDNLDPLTVLPEIVAAAAPAEGPAPGEGAGPAGLPGEAGPGQREAAAATGLPGGATLPPLADLLVGG